LHYLLGELPLLPPDLVPPLEPLDEDPLDDELLPDDGRLYEDEDDELPLLLLLLEDGRL
jgi:hypothetical protein